MAFDWKAIQEQENADLAFYRLLGEMLQRRATYDDLQRIGIFLDELGPGSDAWHTIGEALFHTSGGTSSGYDVWCSWAKNLPDTHYNEALHMAAWERFRADMSDGLEEHTDEPPTIQFDSDAEFDEPEEEARSAGVVTRVLSDPIGEAGAPLIHRDARELLPLLPSGPFTIRLMGQVWDGIDEFTMLSLLRRGVFFGVDILFGARWINAAEHPGFAPLIDRLLEETRTVLSGAARVEAEVTQPGAH